MKNSQDQMRAEKPCGGGAQPQEMLKMKEPPGMCLKTKDSVTICSAKRWRFCTNGRHFTQRHTYLAETVSSFAIFSIPEALRHREKCPLSSSLRASVAQW